MIALIFD